LVTIDFTRAKVIYLKISKKHKKSEPKLAQSVFSGISYQSLHLSLHNEKQLSFHVGMSIVGISIGTQGSEQPSV